MRKSSCTVIAALAVSLLGTSGAHASMPRAAHLPGDVTATECIEGGGVIIISADGDGTGSFTTLCRGGTHDGQTIS
ncbi:Secreted protein OS=Streptomyces tendae OX=1932 GN=GUR47_05105 PE=4 SV=1 [Streptomyces tendae]